MHAYVFADPKGPGVVTNASLGMMHGTEVPYFYRTPFALEESGTAEGAPSGVMMDYVILFVVGLDPNEGRGS